MFLERIEMIFMEPCVADAESVRMFARMSRNIAELMPYLNTVIKNASYNKDSETLCFSKGRRLITLYPDKIALAKAYMRGMTALNEIEGIEATRFVLGGCSKRAQAAWIVAVTDDRVAGIVPMARPGNFTHLIQGRRQGQLPQAGEDAAGKNAPPGHAREYMTRIEDMYSVRGYEYMAYVDPYYFLTRVNVPVMCVVGTNDELFDSFDDHGFYPFYQGDKRFHYVANYGHGMASDQHVQAFRAWAAHCFWGRPVTKLTALGSVEEETLSFEAILHGEAEIKQVNLHYCQLKGRRFDDKTDVYKSVPMKRVGETNLWQVQVPLGKDSGREVYWYVEAVDRTQGLEGLSSTLLDRIAANH